MKGIPVGLCPASIPFIPLIIEIIYIENIDNFWVTFLNEATGVGIMNVINQKAYIKQ
jgi:hypothetical protein